MGALYWPQIYSLRASRHDVWFVVVSDLSIALAHYTIVLVLVQAVFRRKERLFVWVVLLFAGYIGVRGTMQLLTIWTSLHPEYQLGLALRVCTTTLSVATAILLLFALPQLRHMPSPADLAREVAERARVEADLRVREGRFRALLDSAPDAMVISDGNGRIELTNLQAERLFGFSAQEMVGQPVEMLIPPDLRPGYKEDLPAIHRGEMRGRSGTGQELRARRKDGVEIPVEISFSPLDGPNGRSVTAAIRDISERKLADTRFRSLLESAPDAMVIVNHEGLIQLVNVEAERLFGYRREELLGESLAILVPETLRAAHAGHTAAFFRNPKQRQMGADLDLRARRRDGTLFPVEISLSPLEGAEGLTVTAAIRDVSESRLTAKKLAEKVEELRHSNQELEQFAYAASHDLQEPLRMVASYTQLLARRYRGKLDADADQFIAYAVDGTRRMKELIEDLLMYSRAGRGEAPVREFPSAEALKAALDNLQVSLAESGAQVTSGELPEIRGSDAQLVQIFQNLIGNAIKYRGREAPRVHVTGAAEGEEWVFSVADNGIGIDPQHFDRIFVLFKRLHAREEYEGTGIGLAICKRILQQQGGRIWVESAPGRGSTFSFALPMR
jgi:PAS domain S-box-containing protein